MKNRLNPSDPPGTIPVLGKAIRVFEAIARGSGEVTAKGLAASLGIAPATCYRILKSFVASGWIRSRTGGTFELSFGLVPLLQPLLRHEVLIETVREPLAQLAKTTGITTKLTIQQGDYSVTIFSAQSPRPYAISSRVGAIVSLAIGSSGAVYLGALPDSEVNRILDSAPAEAWKFQKRVDVLRRVREGRKLGYYADDGSFQPNFHTLSAPISSSNGKVSAAITLLGFPEDFASAAKSFLVRELKYTAGGCTQLIQNPATVPVT